MSVESDRAKVKRFHLRHPGYAKAQHTRWRKRKQTLHVTTGKCCTFEIADPRDPYCRPRIIGVGLANCDPPWKQFNDVMDYSHGRWAAWLRELRDLGLQPVERTEWAIGRIMPVGRRFATAAASARIGLVNRAHTGSTWLAPLWLLWIPHTVTYVGTWPTTHHYGCVKDGVVKHFPQVKGIPTMRIHLDTCGTDSQGYTWFYD